MKLTQADAEAAAKAMTAQSYDYAGPLLVRIFLDCTYPEAERLLKHVGRYAEKCGPEWPEIPWEGRS